MNTNRTAGRLKENRMGPRMTIFKVKDEQTCKLIEHSPYSPARRSLRAVTRTEEDFE